MNAPFKMNLIALACLITFSTCGNNSYKSEATSGEYVLNDRTQSDEDSSEEMLMDHVVVISDSKDDMAYTERAQTKSSMTVSQKNSESLSASGNVALNPNFIATAAALSVNDGKRQLVRTAQFRFKVKDIVSSTAAIEDIVLKNNGLIMNSTIQNVNQGTTTRQISKDSSLLISYDELNAQLSLRVPKDLLDQTLKEIAQEAIKVDYRILRAEDETFNILWNKMTEIRKLQKSKRLDAAINSRSARLNDVVSAENSREYSEEQADRMKLANLILQDKIDFSNIEIQLYQDRAETHTLVAYESETLSYKPGFGEKAIKGLSNGWSAICSFVLVLINIWPLLLIIAVGAIIFIRYKRRKG